MPSPFVHVLPAITTPFRDDLQVDHEFLAEHARWLLEQGCSGLVPCGSLGESATLKPGEKQAVVTTLVEVAGSHPVLPGIAALSTREAVELAEGAAKAGCRGLMVLPPYVHKGGMHEMRAHVEAVLKATDLPCMLYNNPIAYGTDFTPEFIVDLAEAHENLVAVKESSGDSRRVTAVRALAGDRLDVLIGLDDMVLEGVAAGASGWVAGLVNAFPRESVRLFELARDGKVDAAQALNRWFLPLLRLDTVPEFVQLIKLVQEKVGKGSERVRPPRQVALGALREQALAILEDALAQLPGGTVMSNLQGEHFIAGTAEFGSGEAFTAVDPVSGDAWGAEYHEAGEDQIDRAAAAAGEARRPLGATTAEARAALLRSIADGLVELGDELVECVTAETALPAGRVQGERARTVMQLRQFACGIEEGSWLDVRIDHAEPGRQPAPKPDLRRMNVGIGPIAVFGASNFPLAYSVAGGDTASALAAGCPVVVKGHPAHPGSSELVGRLITECVQSAGMHPGTFSLVHGRSEATGGRLVEHPAIAAVGFTGSHRGGRALLDLAQTRPSPIPVFAEMGSMNPMVILPGALRERGEEIARQIASSVLLAAGQFCTSPGMVLWCEGEGSEKFAQTLRDELGAAATAPSVHPSIRAGYERALEEVESLAVTVEARGESSDAVAAGVCPALLSAGADAVQANPRLRTEIYGPALLAVPCRSTEELLAVVATFHGHLTGTVHGEAEELAGHSEVCALLRERVGRLIANGVPTGVEVCPAMVHGGPYPAATDARYSAVGSSAILRWARPVCWQDWPAECLPPELAEHNPLGIPRTVNGTRE